MKILLTGSAGFIGFHTAKTLLERGDTVIGFDNFNEYYDPELKKRRNEILEKYENFTIVRGDITSNDDLKKAFDLLNQCSEKNAIDSDIKNTHRSPLTAHRSTRVCHLAAQAGVRHSIENPDIFLKDNVIGFGNVIELCKQNNVGGLIYASSSSVYGNSTNEVFAEDQNTDEQVSLYGMTKKANELQASVYNDLFGLHCTGLRFFTVYGPWGRPDMALFLFTNWAVNDEPMKIFGEGKMQRDFTYVDDIVSGIVASLDKNYDCEVFNLGAGHTEELMDYVKAVEDALGKEAKKDFLPMQQGDVVKTSADISKAKEMLGYEPKTRISEGVPRFVSWYKEYYKV
jgi:UDP-glucuronate 4-epimerase